MRGWVRGCVRGCVRGLLGQSPCVERGGRDRTEASAPKVVGFAMVMRMASRGNSSAGPAESTADAETASDNESGVTS